MTMYYLSTITVFLFVFSFWTIDSKVINVQNVDSNSRLTRSSINGINNINLGETFSFTLDCSKFKRDLDVLRSFSYTVQINPLIKTDKTYAVMNSASQVEELGIYNQAGLPIDVFCLVNLRILRVNSTPFVSRYELDDNSIPTGLSPLIGRLSQLRVLSLINTTASHIPAQSLAALTNITILEVDNCGLHEIPSTISLLTNLQQLRLPRNHLHAIPHSTALQQMSKLTHLDLSHNSIHDITDIGEISSRIVATMDFSYNQIDYIPPEISRFYYELYYLYLNDNKLSYIPTDIFQLIYLKKVDLQRNHFPTDEINAIKTRFRSLPNCFITI